MKSTRTINPRKRIALVAHDHKKADLIEWAIHNKTALGRHELVATGTTGHLLEEKLDRPVKRCSADPGRRSADRGDDRGREDRYPDIFLGPHGITNRMTAMLKHSSGWALHGTFSWPATVPQPISSSLPR